MILQSRNVHHPRTFGAMPYGGGYRPRRLSRSRSRLGPYAVSSRQSRRCGTYTSLRSSFRL